MLEEFSPILGTVPEWLATAIRSHGTLVRSRRGNDVVAPGDHSNQVYLLLEGRVQIRLLMPSGAEGILRDLEPGEFFGELAALDEGPRSAWAVALTDCRLARLPGEMFRALVTEQPDAAAWMHKRLVASIRDLTKRWFELNALQVRGRLHCELARMCGGADDAVTVEPAPSHAELAARIGTHREAVTREIGYLCRAGILNQETRPRRLTICDPEGLRKLAETATWGA